VQSVGFWHAHNRYAEVGIGLYQQNYREVDTQSLTTTGTLDSETGHQRQISAGLSWQTNTGWLVQAQYRRQRGATDYNGFLQTSSGLIPFAASTGNTASQLSAQVGYALNAQTWVALPQDWQITPIVRLSEHRWTRNLLQYSETYRFSSHAWGALVQWQARPGTVLEAQYLSGHTQPAQVSAPALGFAATQTSGQFKEWQVGVTQDLQVLTGSDGLATWRAVARYMQSRYNQGASPIVGGLQAPPNQNKPGTWVLGVQKQF
jgi:hypothetical protein